MGAALEGAKQQATSAASSAAGAAKQKAEEAAKAAAAAAKAEAEKAVNAAAIQSAGITDPKQAAAAAGLLGAAGGVGAALSTTTSAFDRFVASPLKRAGTYISENKMKVIGFLLVIALIAVAIWYFTKKPTTPPAQAAENTANTLATAAAAAPATTTGAREGFQDVPAGPVDPASATLANLQPLTIAQAGYLGQAGGADAGRFDPESAISQALRSGFRCFVLQIDFLDAAKGKGFAAPGKPTLVYRGPDGTLLSANTGSIADVAEQLARVGYRPDVPNYDQPLVLYLHILRTPSPVRAPEAYIKYLSQIAKELAPLAPSHLGLTPLGAFHRQKRGAELLTAPLANFQGKTIVLCNADTSLFRAPVKAGQQRIDPAEDLDFWVNMRVYGEGEGRRLGVATPADATVPAHAGVVGLDELLGRSAAAADAFALRGRRRFVITMSDPLKNPSREDLSRAINDFGVNMVPLDIFSGEVEAVKGLVQEYTAMTYRPKPAALRAAPA